MELPYARRSIRQELNEAQHRLHGRNVWFEFRTYGKHTCGVFRSCRSVVFGQWPRLLPSKKLVPTPCGAPWLMRGICMFRYLAGR
jgi:hypothetical protein